MCLPLIVELLMREHSSGIFLAWLIPTVPVPKLLWLAAIEDVCVEYY